MSQRYPNKPDPPPSSTSSSTTVTTDTTASTTSTSTSTTTTPHTSVSTSPSSSSHNELVATPSMCYHCFDVLVRELRSQNNNNNNSNNNNHHHHGSSGSNRHHNLLTMGKGWHRSASSSATRASTSADLSSSSGTPEFVYHLPPSKNPNSIECPLFVTWDKRKQQSLQPFCPFAPTATTTPAIIASENGSSSTATAAATSYELRGCIGTLSPKPLVSSIGEYALISAFKDKRFRPVTLNELPLLRVAVSLLVKYEECDDCYDWVVGTHGIIIRWNTNTASASAANSSRRSSNSGSGDYSATYLPEVALEQRWDQKSAIESLIRKAGYHGRITPELLRSIQCTRYQSSKVRVTFDDYIQARSGTATQQQQQQLQEWSMVVPEGGDWTSSAAGGNSTTLDNGGGGVVVSSSSEIGLLRGWAAVGKEAESSSSPNCQIS